MVSGRPEVLDLRLNGGPDSARLARAALGALAKPFFLRAELMDDLKTAISEACNNAVDHAYLGRSGAVAVRLDVQLESVEVSVRDWGGGFEQITPVGDRLRVGLPLIKTLADRTEYLTAPRSGTEVRMGFDIRHDPRRDPLLARLEDSDYLEAWTPWRLGLTGDVVAMLLPSELLAEVLEPLTSALAARSRFALERFSDVFLLTRAISEFAGSSASSGRISFALGADDDQLKLTIGPLRAGATEELYAMDDSTVLALANEVACEPIADSELLRVVVADHQREQSTGGR